jgi:hypothetical protein
MARLEQMEQGPPEARQGHRHMAQARLLHQLQAKLVAEAVQGIASEHLRERQEMQETRAQHRPTV